MKVMLGDAAVVIGRVNADPAGSMGLGIQGIGQAVAGPRW
jgi:hypothetical protein